MKTNLELCIDLKTKLQNDVLMKPGKNYPGILKREIPSEEFGIDDRCYTFIETQPRTVYKRNPRLFNGRYITVTCRADGSLNLNFKKLVIDDDFSVDSFAIGVCNELRQSLKSLLEGS